MDVLEDVIYRILEIIDNNLDEMKSIHPSWKDFDIKTSWQNAAFLYTQEQRFYKDKGICLSRVILAKIC